MSLAYQTFGSYILFKEILDDALGHMYRAAETDKSGITRNVFIRVFDGTSVPKAEILGEFQTASKIGKVLQAANVAANPIHSDVDGTPAVAFDFVASHPLSRVFEKVHEEGFPVPVDNALLIMEKLALALSAGLAVDAGGQALVHGFLHPGLIMVTNDGEGLVAGFGIADQLLNLIDNTSLTESIHPFIAPEVLVTRSASKRADVYSLGAILYQLLTGQPVPAKQEDRDGLLDRAELAYDERPIPDDIKSLLLKSLAPRPEERFSSAADFKKELDKLLYGGAYSPTTFNLALFMDRLFRSEIELEEKERRQEATVQAQDYLAPPPKPEAVEVEIIPQPGDGSGPNKGLLIGIAALAVVVIAIVIFVMGRGKTEPVVAQATPTPTQEQIDAKAKAEEDRLVALIEERMGEREAEYRAEMEDRQKKIDELQNRLQKTKSTGGLTNEEKQKRAELQKQLAAEQEAIRKREAEAEAERQRELVKAQQEAALKQAATATAVAIAEAAIPTEGPVETTDIPEAKPTAAPEEIVITENMFIEPSQVDTMPVMMKDEKVEWSRLARRSNRKGMVIVQATVNARGKVENVTVLRADEEGFDIPNSVIEAVKKYRFKPATKGGVKVKSYATVTKRYNFRGR